MSGITLKKSSSSNNNNCHLRSVDSSRPKVYDAHPYSINPDLKLLNYKYKQ
jgi:hypothetical protein